MSETEIVPPKDKHELYVWVVDWQGDDAQAFTLNTPSVYGGSDYQTALNSDPRKQSEQGRAKARAALVKITVPLAEMRRLGE
jgi:hypothetical protein